MIIVCDSCGARFHLADGRVGPRGAKVRCSNCHHSFQVAPAAKDAEEKPAARGQNSPRPASAESPRPAPAPPPRPAARPAPKALDDPDLDNPEFLFDEDDAPNTTTIPDDVPFSRSAAPPPGDVTQRHVPAAEESDDTPAGKRAPTPLMGLDPDVSARQLELQRDAERASEANTPSDSASPFDFKHDDFEATPVPGREPSLIAPPPRSAPAAPAATPADLGPDSDAEPDTLARIGSEDLDEAISRWDAPVSRPAAPRREVARGQRVEVLRTPTAPAPSADKERAVRGAEPQAPRPTPVLPVPPPEPFPTPLWLQVLVAAVGLGLVASGTVASLRQTLAPAARAPAAEGEGWIAEQVSAWPARDAAGDPIIEIQGRLRASPGAIPPGVRLTPLDASGTAVGAGVQARVGSDGFAATLPDPPARARSFRVEFTAPAEPQHPPAESTTAALPTPSAPLPGSRDEMPPASAAPAP